jgi:membrane protease YdiL (CAAX protease family)
MHEVIYADRGGRPNEAERDAGAHRVPGAEPSAQYSLAAILGIWALAAMPMALLGWIISPRLAPVAGADPLRAAVTRIMLLTVGLVWLFILSLIIVRHEEGDLRWVTLKRRLRLNTPRDPATGAPRPRLWLVVLPFLVAVAVVDLVLSPALQHAWVSALPFLAEPAGKSFAALFQSPEILTRLEGAWWFLALFVFQALFNTILGEEFLFRGVLLPKMAGVFGRWAWVTNGILFGLYHLHQPWGIANSVVTGLLYSFPAARYRSTWLSIMLHSAQSVYLTLLVLGVVLGLA